MVRLPVLGIFNVLTDVDVCCYTQGLYRHCKRVFTGTWLWEKKSTTPGTRTRVSIVPGFLVRHFTSWAIPCPKSCLEDSPHMSSISHICRSSLNGLVSCCQILHCFIFLSFQICPGELEMCDWRLCIAGGHVCRIWQTDSMLLFCCKPTQVTVFTDQNISVAIGNWLKI